MSYTLRTAGHCRRVVWLRVVVQLPILLMAVSLDNMIQYAAFPHNKEGFVLLRVVLVVMLVGTGISAQASSLDVALSGDSARVGYIAPFRAGDFGLNQYEVGVLFTDRDDVVASFGLRVSDEAGADSPGLEVGLGLKAYAASADNNGSLALGLGGEMHYLPPNLKRVGFGLFGYFAPDIVAFIDSDKFFEWGARLEYQVLPEATLYLGYRKVEMGLNTGGNLNIDSGGHLGIKYGF